MKKKGSLEELLGGLGTKKNEAETDRKRLPGRPILSCCTAADAGQWPVLSDALLLGRRR